MTEILDQVSRNDLVNYRISRAEETLREATLLAGESHFNAAINRLYYACFYSISAVLVKKGVVASSHSGVKTMFNLHIISKGVLPIEYGKTFSRLFEIRHSGDYDDFVYCDQEMYDTYAPKAKSIVEAIKVLIE